MLRAEASPFVAGLAATARASSSAKAGLAFAAVTVATAPVAYMAMFTGFQAYDDEGYFLLTLRDFISGHPLFSAALPIYGPFFYEVMGGVFKVLGLQPDLDSGRLVTVAVWLIASLLGGILTLRLTSSLWLGFGGQLLTFRVLGVLTNEPMHPAGLLSVMLLSLMIAGTFKSSRPRAAAAVMGGIAGAILLVKVNIGIFAAVAVMFALAGSLTDRWRRLALPAMALVAVVLPPVLMASLINRPWALEFALLVSLSAAALGVTALWIRPVPSVAPSAKWLTIGGVAVVLACLGVMVAGGTRLEDMWTKSILVGARLPQVFTLPTVVNPTSDIWAALSLVTAVAVCGRYARLAALPAAGLFRVWAGLLTWVSMIVLPGVLLTVPLAWIAIQRAQTVDDEVGGFSRLLLPALAVIGSLQVYPVSGTQLSLAALGLLPIGAITISDGIRQLRTAHNAPGGQERLVSLIVPSALILTIGAFLLYVFITVTLFAADKPFGIPGAESVRLPADQRTRLRGLVFAVDHDCSTFITFPGMNSLYVWTAQKPPGQVTTGVWMLVLDSGQQQAIVEQIKDRQGLCVVKNQTVIDFWAQGRQVPNDPLVVFIETNFVVAGSYGDYEVLVRR
jgi:hypothetical protein